MIGRAAALAILAALAALARRDVELQVRVAAGNFTDALKRRLRQRRPPQVRMQDHACGVHDRFERKLH